MTQITEEYRCPLTGDGPCPRWEYHLEPRYRPPGFACPLVPGKVMPPGTTDEQAEHERALMRAPSWDRVSDGRVVVWVEM